ncbi:MAG: site-specific integrase [Mangrovibacterium sp.]
MIKSTFNVAFFIKRNAQRKDGTVPIVSRITINKQVAQFNTKLHILPNKWNAKLGKAAGQTAPARELNVLLQDIRGRIHEIYHKLTIHDDHVTSDKVKNEFLGLNANNETILQLFDKHNEDYKKLVGISKAEATYKKYIVTRRHVAEFMKRKLKVSDMALREVNHMFLEEFSIYLQTQCECNFNSTAKHLQRFKRIVFIAKSNGWIKKDPFVSFKIQFKKVDRGYLTEAELERIFKKQFPTKRLEQVRDIFIFSCFTGLAYIDVKNLTKDNIQKGFDGNDWIMAKRQKTDTIISIPLLDIPRIILKKYEGIADDGKLLPILSNQKMNSYLKEVGDLCAVNKNLTYHLARHREFLFAYN